MFVLVYVEEKLSFMHRSRVDIMANILRVSAGGAKKTHIMYGCNLSYKQLQTYLDLLADRELLKTKSEKGNKGYYETTPKGRAFLKCYQDIQVLLAT